MINKKINKKQQSLQVIRCVSVLTVLLGLWVLSSCESKKSDSAEAIPSTNHAEETASLGAIPDTINFDEHVRPIFNKNCTGCHGGVNKVAVKEGEKSKMPGGISLIYPLKGVKGESENLAVMAGNPEASEIYKLITTSNEEMRMPPALHRPRLKQHEIEIIKKWIEQGAEWNPHWAYKAPKSMPAPKTKQGWGNNKIDAFILSKMEQKGLTPSAEATPAELLRRVSFDLTGLPPSIEDLDRFENAYAADANAAYEAEVNRLLASEQYGERWASVWLDLARYADSEGLGVDRKRDVWPYRDWIIESYNKDMPFDQFTIKQLAGDLIENPTERDLIATTFHRLTQANDEGGTNDEEFRVAAVVDRVNTTWDVWQGQTFGCVQCHSHPYDTIEHKEYYSFMAFFNNTSDGDQTNHYPTIKVPKKKAYYPKAKQLRLVYKQAESQYLNTAHKLIKHSEWLATESASLQSTKSKSKLKNNEIQIVGNKVNGTKFSLTWKPKGQTLEALRLSILPIDEEEAKSYSEDGSVLSYISLSITKEDGTVIEIPMQHIISDSMESTIYPRHSLNKKSAVGWGPFSKLFHPRWVVIVPKEAVDLNGVKSVTLDMTYRYNYLAGMVLVPMRSRVEYTSQGSLWQSWKEQGANHLAAYEKARKAYHKISGPSIPIMQNREVQLSRNTHIFDRGNWLTKGELIEKADTPHTFAPLNAASKDPNRLDLANWLVSPKNTLTARVAVNRYWHQLFGRGIVETLEDFGSSGMKPSHPALLDDLAVRFQREYKWSQKKMLKEMVMSATYRQSSAVRAEHRAKDPENRLLSYAPRRRLRAEAVMDMGLSNSGLLTQQLYGHPTYPPIPPGVWKPFVTSDKWITPKIGDPQRYRRAIYTYWKRSIPFPALMSFDAPSREICSKRRLVSNTPVAALTTLNDESYAEYSMGLARRMKYDYKGTLEEKLAHGYRITTSSRPDKETLDHLVDAYKSAEKNYKDHPEQLNGIAGTPDGAAFTIIASILLNLDASLTK